jgi:hypothetical protein
MTKSYEQQAFEDAMNDLYFQYHKGYRLGKLADRYEFAEKHNLDTKFINTTISCDNDHL